MRHAAYVNYHIKSAEPQAFHFDVDGIDDSVAIRKPARNVHTHLGHSALDMEAAGDALAPRKSIESRTLVRYQ